MVRDHQARIRQWSRCAHPHRQAARDHMAGAMQPSSAKRKAHFASAARAQQREAKQYFEQAVHQHERAEAAPEAAHDQWASIRNLFLAAGVSWARSSSVRKSIVLNSLSHAGAPQILAPTPI
jgi:hypothetical protein